MTKYDGPPPGMRFKPIDREGLNPNVIVGDPPGTSRRNLEMPEQPPVTTENTNPYSGLEKVGETAIANSSNSTIETTRYRNKQGQEVVGRKKTVTRHDPEKFRDVKIVTETLTTYEGSGD